LTCFTSAKKKSVSCVLVTDAKGILECFHFSMEKMVFMFRVILGELVRIRRKDESEFTYRVNSCFNKSTGHWNAIQLFDDPQLNVDQMHRLGSGLGFSVTIRGRAKNNRKKKWHGGDILTLNTLTPTAISTASEKSGFSTP